MRRQRALRLAEGLPGFFGQGGGDVGLATVNGADGETARADRAPARGEPRLARLMGRVEVGPEAVGQRRELVAPVRRAVRRLLG
jgi:hypothetical protein